MKSDVLIIGGGLGGLTAGTYLAQNGLKVTLLEAQSHVGGYAIAFKRDEFIFDVALHAVPAGNPGQPFFNLIQDLRLEPEVTFLKLHEAFRIKLGSFEFIIPNDYDELFDKLIQQYPGESGGLKALKKDLSKYAALYFNILETNPNFWQITTHFVPRIPKFLKHTRISTKAYLDQFINDPFLQAILYQAAVFFGIPMKQFPAINFMIMFYLLFTTGMFTLKGGGQALTDALEKKMKKCGATILPDKRVVKVIVDEGKALAVKTSEGEEYDARVIISNVNTPQLVHYLIGDNYFSLSYLKALNQLKSSLAILQMHLGLDCKVKQLGLSNHISLFFPDENIDAAMEQQNRSSMLNGFSLLAPGITDPRPEANNERVLSIVGGVSAEYWLDLSEQTYRQQKSNAVEQIMAMIEKEYPTIRKHIKTIDLATPHSFKRYTTNPNGAILGFDSALGMHRPMMKISQFPFKNIFLANAWTSKLGGFMQCMKAGLMAGRKTLKYLS